MIGYKYLCSRNIDIVKNTTDMNANKGISCLLNLDLWKKFLMPIVASEHIKTSTATASAGTPLFNNIGAGKMI